ncbi:MAG: BrnT family toxin [Thermodesulfobacteriota bacterium]
MQFVWDESKRIANRKKHRLDFAVGWKVFAGPTFTFEDRRFEYAEQRFISMGLLDRQVVLIAHTEIAKEIRIISMRKANKNEQKIFFENL